MISFKEFVINEAVVWRDSRAKDRRTATRVQFLRHAEERFAERNIAKDKMTPAEVRDFYQRVIEKATKDCKVSTIDDPQPYLIYSIGLRQGIVCFYQRGLCDYDGPNPHVFVKTWLPRGNSEIRDWYGAKRKTIKFVIENKEENCIYLEID